MWDAVNVVQLLIDILGMKLAQEEWSIVNGHLTSVASDEMRISSSSDWSARQSVLFCEEAVS